LLVARRRVGYIGVVEGSGEIGDVREGRGRCELESREMRGKDRGRKLRSLLSVSSEAIPPENNGD
jgi:hypothetical protein